MSQLCRTMYSVRYYVIVRNVLPDSMIERPAARGARGVKEALIINSACHVPRIAFPYEVPLNKELARKKGVWHRKNRREYCTYGGTVRSR